MTRAVICLTGEDTWRFLQGLITSDLSRTLKKLSYGALLTPQGKFLFDFFIFSLEANQFFIDIDNSAKEDFLSRISLYKLRLKMDASEANVDVLLSREKLNKVLSMRDPRHNELGFRNYLFEGSSQKKMAFNNKLWDKAAYEHVRIRNCVPKFGKELFTNETYILEANFINLSGVSFSKGCFVGQEVTARMRHKTKLRKGLKVVSFVEGANDVSLTYGSAIFSGTKEVGKLLSCSKNLAIAYLRFDRIEEQLKCKETVLQIVN